ITRRFQAMKSEWGISKFISKKFMSDPSNGYLVDDNCVLGAEVFVNVVTPYKRNWKIPNFSKLGKVWNSEQFSAGGHKYGKINLYPKGNGEATGRSVFIKNHENPGGYCKGEFTKFSYVSTIDNFQCVIII
ncbi:hypothetical protein MIMGU_mgv1a026528mg, partial [Erythranthe guttata]